ncbi:Hypothetical protein A7982_10081 [Minicystis rosea]|nr:Hypothetical protein A7982_10081 [Minicystis rosea]
MPNVQCHHCGQMFPKAQRRKGRCHYCYGNAGYCRDCAWWELGPLPAQAGLPPALRPTNRRTGLSTISCFGAPPNQPADPQGVNLLTQMRHDCGLIDYQMTHHGFDADTGVHGHAYARDAGYGYATPGGAVANPAWNQAEPNAAPGLATWGGAVTNFDTLAPRLIDRFDALYMLDDGQHGGLEFNQMMRSLAVIFASAVERCQYVNDIYVHRRDAPTIAARHLDVCFTHGGNVFYVPTVEQAPARHALALAAVFEHVLLGKMSLSTAYFTIRDATGGGTLARRTIKLAAIVLHVFYAERPLDVVPNGANFNPERAHGYFTAESKRRLLSTSGNSWSDRAKNIWGALYAAFANGAHVPAGRGPTNDVRVRFPDANVQGHATLSPLQKYYLQSHPKMDATGLNVPNASPCELAVRERVISRLKAIARAGAVDPAYTGGGGPFANYQGQNNNALIEVLLDQILDDMNSEEYWFETSLGSYPLEHIYLPNQPAFYIKNQAELWTFQVNWEHVFPDCANVPNQTFTGFRMLPHMLAYQTDGRQNAKRWYIDWRNDKDQYLYDGFQFSFPDRPAFTNYSTAPRAPEPNTNYGNHQVVWSSDLRHRSVIGVGDKGVVYRSRLLLLQDLLCDIPMATGEAHGAADKALLVQRIFTHLALKVPAPGGPQVALGNWLAALVGRWNVLDHPVGMDSMQRVILQDRFNQPLTSIFECHVFGQMQIDRDAWALTLAKGAISPGNTDAGAPTDAWVGNVAALGGKPYVVTQYRAMLGGVAAPRNLTPLVLTNNAPILTQIGRAP